MSNRASRNEVSLPAVRFRSLLSLHRRMGVVSALFIILLSFSGLILHHGSLFDLDEQFINSSRLLRWYDIEVPDISIAYRAGQHGVQLIAESIYFDSVRLPGSFADLKGLVTTDFGFVAATASQLLLLTERGEIIEILGQVNRVPTGIRRIGSSRSAQLVLQTNAGLFDADLELLRWSQSLSAESQFDWSEPSPTEIGLVSQVQSDYAASLISWERLLLDIHSGRVLGDLGVVLVDIMALLFMLMAASGVWIWTRRRN